MSVGTQIQASRRLVIIQWLMGLGAWLFLALPCLRRTHGMHHLRRGRQYLFAANHVSLLDTILLGALCWRSGFYPILVLGDKKTWQASWFKRALSRPIGFLLDRGRLNRGRIRELQAFARAGRSRHLVVFPEGTRGDGVNVAPCQPGLYYVAREARLPIVPVFIENMQLVSTKTGRFHPFAGLNRVKVHYGKPIEPEAYLKMSREEFCDFIRWNIASLPPLPATVCLSPALPQT